MKYCLRSGALFLALLSFDAALYVPADAANSGLDTPTGVTSLPFGIEGAEVMTLTGTGLGIGTTSPAALLHAYANGSTYAAMRLETINSGP